MNYQLSPQSKRIQEVIKLAIETGMVDPNEQMFQDKFEHLWSEMIGPSWKEDVALMIWEMTERHQAILNLPPMMPPINPN